MHGKAPFAPIQTLLLLLLLVSCFFSHFLFPALSAKVVTHLPGFNGTLPFYLETGYVSVDEDTGSELFYYFIESERNPRADPLLLWLTGGPMCSVFSAIAFEIGPLKFVVAPYNGSLPQLEYFPYSWTKLANILFVDSPVGSGFSFSVQDYDIADISSSLQVHEFLMKWFTDHPQYLSNPFYIGGDSYAGKVVPFITQKASEYIEAGRRPLFNLKGYLVGNPTTDEPIDESYRVRSAHGFGIVSDQIYEMTVRSCKGDNYQYPRSQVCAESVDTVNKLISEIDSAQVLENNCVLVSPMPIPENTEISRKLLTDEDLELHNPPTRPPFNCRSYEYYLSYIWANNDTTRDALGIKKGTVKEWIRCKFDYPYIRDIPSSIKYHRNLTIRGYRALVYSGDHDLVVPLLATQAWVRSLNYSIVDDWRAWHLDGQAAGFTITYSNNMTFATIKGGGHTAPEYRPKECLTMIQRWLSHESL